MSNSFHRNELFQTNPKVDFQSINAIRLSKRLSSEKNSMPEKLQVGNEID